MDKGSGEHLRSEAMQDKESFNTVPNLLTLIRIILVPVVIFLLRFKTPSTDIAAALVFGVAAITDYFDGHIARKSNLVSTYGKLMDPLADKFLVVCSLIALMELGRVGSVLVMLLVCRELAITGLRALASAEGVIIQASSGGKWKTGFQMTGIPFLMVEPGIFGIPMAKIGLVLVYFSLALSLWSAFEYAVDFFKALRTRIKTKKPFKKKHKTKSSS